MDNEISVKDEVDVEISPHCIQTDVKSEQSPARDDENECTPLRDDCHPSTEPTFFGSVNAGWESDADEDEAIVTTLPPFLGLDKSIKSSPTNDNDLTPIRVSERDQSNSADTQFESQPIGDVADVPDNFLDDLEADAMVTVLETIVKEEENSEFPFGILAVRSAEDLQGATNTCSRQDQLDDMDLERPPTETQQYCEYTEEELSERIDQRVKQLEKLKKKNKKNKKNKKHNGHKKRSRSQSRSPHSSRKERRVDHTPTSSTSRHLFTYEVKAEPADIDYIPVQDIEKSVEVIAPSKSSDIATEVRAGAAAPSPLLTIKEKRKLAVERAKEVLSLLRLQDSKAPATEFLVVDTYIKKLPTRASFTSNDIFESPSPLCNNFNVKYRFNSTTASNIDVAKWGLQRLPEETTQLLRITGIDASRLMELMANSKMDLHKLRSQQVSNKAEDEYASTGLYTSVSTQTDALNCYRDVAIQATPASNQGVFWLQPSFDKIHLVQSQANVMLALKELSSRMPSSSAWADMLFQKLLQALAIHRAEANELAR
ncbi:protein panoramix [Drosophila grimshawi]|uniref:GH20339 n=1 Tax=Drosophila grimshawi TaxID=7222 RepID=B4J4G9_DROGR|nr:protein panoramix [Drosophila grimshawi]EDW01651.1 GH20339 [Drosophila grimshawi]